MPMNQALQKNLKDMKKSDNKSICFIIPAGKIKGKFGDYDSNNQTVTISSPTFSDLVVGAKLVILVEAIQAWGQ